MNVACTAEVGLCGDIRPLDEPLKRKLLINGVHLVDRLSTDLVFVGELASAQCITWPQREHLMHVTQPRNRNEKLLDFLTRRSVADFHKFVNILAKEQEFLVPFMIADGGQASLITIAELLSSNSPLTLTFRHGSG